MNPLDQTLPVFPPIPVPPPHPSIPNWQDPLQQKKVGSEAVKVVGATATFYAIARVAPHPAIRLVASFLAGFAETGDAKLKPSPAIFTNFLPKPIGYVDPLTYGLPPNFYLPSFASKLLPTALDGKVPGLAQQRAEDLAAAMTASQIKAPKVVAGESNDTLLKLAGTDQVGDPTRATFLVATSGVNRIDLRVAAQRELLRRGVTPDQIPNLTNPTAGFSDPLGFNASIHPQTVNAGVTGVVVAQGSTLPALVQSVNDAAKRNAAGAKGINRDLAQERADP